MRRVGFGAVLAVGAFLLVGPAPAADAAACSGSSGVTVVVDFGPLGGIQVGCAAGDPGTGLSALHSAGFGTTGTQHDGPAFVCRINGAPAADKCIATPPASAYWSYWHASRGGSWSYSTAGAASFNPRAGSVEGWSFGAGARPGIAPPAAPAPPPPPPAPEPTTRPAPKPTVKPAPPRTSAPPVVPGAPSTTRSGAPTSGPRPSTASSTSPAATPGASTAAPSTSAGASGSPTAVAGTQATEEPGPPAGSLPTDGGGSSILPVLGTIAGVVLVAALAVIAFVMDRRRRNAL